MLINNTIFNADLMDILLELQSQLHLNGIELLSKIKDGPKNIQVTCPYHSGGQERRPSAGIKKDSGVFHCFSCGETHTLPEVISYCFGHDDMMGSWGWQWLLKNFLTIGVEERKDIRLDFERDRGPDESTAEYVSEEELDSYRYYHPYLETRGIVDDSIIELFDIGYDRATKCITFPVRDKNGNCLFVARRSVQTKFFNYPANAEKPLYGLYELTSLHTPISEVWVCESMIDCILLWQSGRCAVALNGLGNERQFQQLRDLPCRILVLSTDMDDAGMKAREVIRSKVRNKLIKEVFLPKGRKDIGECTSVEIKNLEVEI